MSKTEVTNPTMTGILRHWDPAKKFGFVENSQYLDIYVNVRLLADPGDAIWLRAGTPVRFALLKMPDGRLRAANLTVAE